MDNNRQIRIRISIFIVIAAIILTVILGRLVNIQIIGGLVDSDSSQFYTATKTITASRGSIYDNSGNTLFARSITKYDVAVDQKNAAKWQTINCDEPHMNVCYQTKDGKNIPYDGVLGLAILLEPYLGIKKETLAYDLTGNSSHKVIAKSVEPKVAYAVQDLNISFLSIDKTSTREYPQGNLAGSLVGAAMTQPGGKIYAVAGIEAAADKELSGEDGEIEYESASGGMKIPQGFQREKKKVVDGLDVKSSIDSDVQWKLQQILDAAVTKYKANWIMSGVIKVKTGEVLAITSNGEATAGSDEVKEHGSRVMNTAFEPGSTMKTITAAGLINDGLSSPESKYSVPGYELNTGFAPDPIHDFSHHGAGTWTLAGIIGNSFNTGTVIASRPWSLQSRYDTFTRFGYGKLSGSNFPGETPGLFYEPDYWDGRTRDTILFGQGMSVSVLQMLSAYGTIANYGQRVTPTFISATRPIGSGNDWIPYQNPTPPSQVISEDAARKTLGIMESCVEKTGCRMGKIPNYRIGAKTGTAEQLPSNSIVHTYIGAFPLDDPQFVVGVWVCDNEDQNTSGLTTPIFKDISSFIIQKYGINPSAPADFIYPPL